MHVTEQALPGVLHMCPGSPVERTGRRAVTWSAQRTQGSHVERTEDAGQSVAQSDAACAAVAEACRR